MLCKQRSSSEREWPDSCASRLERMKGLEDNREGYIVLRANARKSRKDGIRVAGRYEISSGRNYG